jgi:hypothetical protein
MPHRSPPSVILAAAIALLPACGELPSSRPSPSQLESELQAAARDAQPGLPIKLDDLTQITEIRVEGTELVSTLQVSVPFPDTPANLQQREQGSISARICANPDAADLIRDGGTVRYDYRDPTGQSFSVRVTACP